MRLREALRGAVFVSACAFVAGCGGSGEASQQSTSVISSAAGPSTPDPEELSRLLSFTPMPTSTPRGPTPRPSPTPRPVLQIHGEGYDIIGPGNGLYEIAAYPTAKSGAARNANNAIARIAESCAISSSNDRRPVYTASGDELAVQVTTVYPNCTVR